MMPRDATLPAVITGLAVRIGYVVVFSILFTPSLNSNDSNSAVPVEAAKEISFGVALERPDCKERRNGQGACYNRDSWNFRDSP